MNNEYKVTVPDGVSGDWRIERFTVTPDDEKWERIRAMQSGRFTPAGTYTRLMRGRDVVMSDTPDEIRDHIYAIHKATGHVLINGLGLGMVLQAVARKSDVQSVTVIEQSPDVIALVAPHYRQMFGDRVNIIHANAYEWQPPQGIRYGMVWHDIWDNMCEDNLSEMTRLHRKYGRRTDWQGSWGKEWIQAHLR